jgi:hypothetical protein
MKEPNVYEIAQHFLVGLQVCVRHARFIGGGEGCAAHAVCPRTDAADCCVCVDACYGLSCLGWSVGAARTSVLLLCRAGLRLNCRVQAQLSCLGQAAGAVTLTRPSLLYVVVTCHACCTAAGCGVLFGAGLMHGQWRTPALSCSLVGSLGSASVCKKDPTMPVAQLSCTA